MCVALNWAGVCASRLLFGCASKPKGLFTSLKMPILPSAKDIYRPGCPFLLSMHVMFSLAAFAVGVAAGARKKHITT